MLRPPGHLRSTSEQPGNVTFSPSHARNASVPPPNTTPKSGNTLLKKSPRPGADKLPPVADNSPPLPPPSTVPFYGTVSRSTPPKPLAPPLRTNLPPQILYATPTPASETAGGPSPELFYTSSPSHPPPPLPRVPLYVANAGPDETDSVTSPPPPLLSANAFRDTSIGECSQGDGERVRESEFSTLSDNSMDIPLAWTGGLPTTMEEEDPSSGRESAGQSYAQTHRDTPSTPETNPDDRAFSPNTIPGSWVDQESPNERFQGRSVQQRTSLPLPQPINLPTKVEQNTAPGYFPNVVGDSRMQSVPQKGRPATAHDSADADLTRGWVLVNVTASPGFDSRRFDNGLSPADPMPLPTPGVETPHGNGGPIAPPVAPKPKPKSRPPAHNTFSTSGSGGGGGGSEFGAMSNGGQQSAPLGGSVGRSYGARTGNGTGRPGGPDRPPMVPPPMPVSKASFKKMFTRSNSQRSQKRGQGFNDEQVNIARGVTMLEGSAPVSLVWKRGVNKSVSQLATYSAADLLGPPPILLPSPRPSLPMPSGSEPDLLELDLSSPSSSSSPPPSLSSNFLAVSNLSPLQGGGLAAGTGHWVPGSTLTTYPAPYHGNASF